MVLNFWRTAADAEFEGGPPMLLCVPVFRPLFFGSVVCGCFIRYWVLDGVNWSWKHGVCDASNPRLNLVNRVLLNSQAKAKSCRSKKAKKMLAKIAVLSFSLQLYLHHILIMLFHLLILDIRLYLLIICNFSCNLSHLFTLDNLEHGKKIQQNLLCVEAVQSSAIPIRKFHPWRDIVFGLESVIHDQKERFRKSSRC